ncbi:uncharacterized protein N7459_004754 [Penicillium hispanicum]|uniref:uncharacterized protein n=1 Tax=Penicillium hispanicum TaxID=1080232 RepID=UPI0025406CC9|nr:uncharacterized protein N7459_004754 [Penicillium hispanicum]KAJ5584954.1 hypothetical protein N7459_004754 [Penicillium hispanicum]
MVFARRSALRAFTAMQVFRTAPVARGSARMLGRRFASTGKGYVEHKTSDLPWLLGSVGLGGPVIAYLLLSGPEKKPHGDAHGHDDDTEHKESHEEEPSEEEPADDVEQQPKDDEKAEQPAEEKPEELKDEDTHKQDTAEEPKKDETSDKPQNDEPAAAKAPGGPESTSFKQDKLSNADTDHPHMNDPGKSEKGEGEPETAKLKGTVSPERPQK